MEKVGHDYLTEPFFIQQTAAAATAMTCPTTT